MCSLSQMLATHTLRESILFPTSIEDNSITRETTLSSTWSKIFPSEAQLCFSPIPPESQMLRFTCSIQSLSTPRHTQCIEPEGLASTFTLKFEIWFFRTAQQSTNFLICQQSTQRTSTIWALNNPRLFKYKCRPLLFSALCRQTFSIFKISVLLIIS